MLAGNQVQRECHISVRSTCNAGRMWGKVPTSQLAQADGSCATRCRQQAFRLVETEDLVALRKLLHSSFLLAQLVLPPPACAELPGDSFGSYTSGPQAHMLADTMCSKDCSYPELSNKKSHHNMHTPI